MSYAQENIKTNKQGTDIVYTGIIKDQGFLILFRQF